MGVCGGSSKRGVSGSSGSIGCPLTSKRVGGSSSSLWYLGSSVLVVLLRTSPLLRCPSPSSCS